MASETELAWAAGFFDGEGWFSVNARSKTLEMGLGQQHPSAGHVLPRFLTAVGVGRIYDEREGTFASWRATKAEDQKLALGALWPYLSIPKRTQAREALTRLREVRADLTRRVGAVEETYDEIEGVMQS